MAFLKHSNLKVSQLYWLAISFAASMGFATVSQASAPLTRAATLSANSVELAQTQTQTQPQLTIDQLPMARLADAAALTYGASTRGALNLSSIVHRGRRFAIYRFDGEAGQLVRANLLGGLASERSPDRLQSDALLINPVLVLVDPNGAIIAQQPEQTNMANATIRMALPETGTYILFVTSSSSGVGGRYSLNLEQIQPVN